MIAPLASRGIVGQTSDAAIVYDAETTHGGSGGPVLNARGEVIAVNAAILPEFGGSNLGVPVNKVRAFLAEVEGAWALRLVRHGSISARQPPLPGPLRKGRRIAYGVPTIFSGTASR